MVKKEKKLNYKDIRGKRIRYPSLRLVFVPYLLLLLSFVISAFWVRDWQTIKIMLLTFLPIVLVFVLMAVLLVVFGKIVCVLTKDKLYFFNQPLIELNRLTGKKRKSSSDGSVEYKNIKFMEYVPAVYKWLGTRKNILYPQHVILKGEDYQLTLLYANKSLLSKLNRLVPLPEEMCAIPDFDDREHERSGLFEAVWNSLERNLAEQIFDDQIKIDYFSKNESDNLITLIVSKNGEEITFYIDEEELSMFLDDSKIQRSVLLSDISAVEELYSQMKGFVDKHT